MNGCTRTDEDEIKELFEKNILKLSDRKRF